VRAPVLLLPLALLPLARRGLLPPGLAFVLANGAWLIVLGALAAAAVLFWRGAGLPSERLWTRVSTWLDGRPTRWVALAPALVALVAALLLVPAYRWYGLPSGDEPKYLRLAVSLYRDLDADVAASKAALDIALQNQRRSEVKAPESGVINTRTIETGTYVRPGTVLATIVDVSRLRLRFKISEGESLQVAEGQDVSFRVAPIGPRDFVGRVYHVGEVADPTTRQVEVLAWVQNTGELKPGFFAEVSFNAGTKENAVVVPEAAIKASESGFVAYVVEEGKAVKKPIEIGLRTEDGLVEILSGLSGAETVVVEGSDLLADGVAVEDADLENPETPPAPPEGRAR